MRDGFDFDHTSIGVEDLEGWAEVIRRKLGGFVITGQEVHDFRYLLFHVGTPPAGGRLELIAPFGDESFMTRFVGKHGDTFHHITFTVPDIEETYERLRALDLTLTHVDFSHEPWRELIVMPDRVHGVVIQIADTTLGFPPLAELAATTTRDVAAYPFNKGGSTHEFWTDVWDVAPERHATVLRTHLGSTDPDLSRELFGDILHGELQREGDHDVFTWGGTALEVSASDAPGITAMTVDAIAGGSLSIGNALLRSPDRADRRHFVHPLIRPAASRTMEDRCT